MSTKTVRRFKKGDLVKIVTNTKLDVLMKKSGLTIFATVLECRYKTDAYRILPANNPLTSEAYWIGGDNIEVARY